MIIASWFILISLCFSWTRLSTASPEISMTSREVESSGGQPVEKSLTRYDQEQPSERVFTIRNYQHEKKKRKYRFPQRQKEKSITSSGLGSENTTPEMKFQKTFGKSPKTFPENDIHGSILLESTTKKKESHLKGKDNVVNPWKQFNDEFNVRDRHEDQLQEIGSSGINHHSVRRVKRYMMYPNLIIEPYDRSDYEATGDYTDDDDCTVNNENCKDLKELNKCDAKKYPAKFYQNKKTTACEWGGVYRSRCGVYICNYTNLNEEGKGQTTYYKNNTFCELKPEPCTTTNMFDYNPVCERQCYCVMDKNITFCEGYPCWSPHFVRAYLDFEANGTDTTKDTKGTSKGTTQVGMKTTHPMKTEKTYTTKDTKETSKGWSQVDGKTTHPGKTVTVNGRSLSAVIDRTQSAVIDRSISAVTDDMQSVTDDMQSAVTDDMQSAVTDDMQSAVTDGTTSAVTDGTTSAVTDDMQSAVTDDTTSAVTDDTTSEPEPKQRGLLTEAHEFFTGPDGTYNDSDAVLTDILEKYNLRDVLGQMLLRDYRRIEALEKTMRGKKTKENVTLAPQKGDAPANTV